MENHIFDKEKSEREFEINVTCTMQRTLPVKTADYSEGVDDDGFIVRKASTEDLRDIYRDGHMELEDLLTRLTDVAVKWRRDVLLRQIAEGHDNGTVKQLAEVDYLISEAECWSCQDVEYSQE